MLRLKGGALRHFCGTEFRRLAFHQNDTGLKTRHERLTGRGLGITERQSVQRRQRFLTTRAGADRCHT